MRERLQVAEKRLLARWKDTGPKHSLSSWCYWEAIRLEAALPPSEKIEEVARLVDSEIRRRHNGFGKPPDADDIAAILREAPGRQIDDNESDEN